MVVKVGKVGKIVVTYSEYVKSNFYKELKNLSKNKKKPKAFTIPPTYLLIAIYIIFLIKT